MVARHLATFLEVYFSEVALVMQKIMENVEMVEISFLYPDEDMVLKNCWNLWFKLKFHDKIWLLLVAAHFRKPFLVTKGWGGGGGGFVGHSRSLYRIENVIFTLEILVKPKTAALWYALCGIMAASADLCSVNHHPGSIRHCSGKLQVRVRLPKRVLQQQHSNRY